MPETLGHEPGLLEKILLGLAISSLILLGIVLSQPVWRGEAMAQEFKSDCAKRGGVLLEHKNFMGTKLRCASRLD